MRLKSEALLAVAFSLAIVGVSGCTKDISVRSHPTGAMVYVNNEPRGRTPTTIQLREDFDPFMMQRYEVRVEREGHQPYMRNLVNDWAFHSYPKTIFAELRPLTSWMSGSSGQVSSDADAAPSLKPRASIRNVHVLVIGVKKYQDKTIPALKYSDSDAQAVYEFFKSSPRSPARPENVHYLGDTPNDDGMVADRKGIMKALSAYLMEKATDERDMAILYFSGHGDAGKHPTKNAAYYLIPHDAERSDLYNTAIELDELQNRWRAIRAGTRIMIADACNAGGFGGMKNLSIRGVESVQSSGTIVMASANANQKSLESDKDKRGLFTQVLLEGLEGRADDQYGDRDGRVSLGELRSWIDKVVPKRAAQAGGKQTPVIKVPDGWEGLYLTR